MKICPIPTTILFDDTISLYAKGLYCILFAKNTLPDDSKTKKALKELIKNGYVSITDNNVYFKK